MAATTERQAPRPFFATFRRHTKRFLRTGDVPVGSVKWGALRRTAPISRQYGYARGKPVDRYYIEDFLTHWSADIHGRVLEIKEPEYTRDLGGARVTQSDVLDIDKANRHATIIADLNGPTRLPSDAYDCIIFTQTLQYIYRFEHALRELHRALKPGGVLLMTVPGITPSAESEHRFWSFTPFSVRQLLGEVFATDCEDLSTYGNLMTATAFLYGLCAEELRAEELEAHDPDYPVIVAARSVKAQ